MKIKWFTVIYCQKKSRAEIKIEFNFIYLTRRNQHVFITRRRQNVNIFTKGDYGRSECDKIIPITVSNLKTNSLSPLKYICPNLQSLSENSSEEEFLKPSQSSLKTHQSKMNTRFEFLSPELRHIESNRAFRSIFRFFEDSNTFPVSASDSTFLR